MINKNFWTKIANKWVMKDDGIIIPDDGFEPPIIDDSELLNFDIGAIDDEINDILADLGLDDF